MDTSALSKRYLAEVGSVWVTTQVQTAGNVVLISELTTVEHCSVLARKRLQKQLALSQAFRLKADFLSHVAKEYLVVPISGTVLVQARNLVDKYLFLRTLDAIQLASALDGTTSLAEPFTFVSADTDLLSAAASEGFAVDNPLSHP